MLVYRVTVSDKQGGTPFCHFETLKKFDAMRYKERAEALGQVVAVMQERMTSYDPL